MFLDYAFGRGNWSLAALKAGAARVVAVDAAAVNVQRFSNYCGEHGIERIDIVHGNILENAIDATVDVIWVYGILPCVAESERFLARLAALRRDDDALALLYAYDRGSLRQKVVDTARRGAVYPDARSFAEDSYLFTPAARMRARDDLLAPRVMWHSMADLAALAQHNGFVARRSVADFRAWATGIPSLEFSAHHLVCGFTGSPKRMSEPVRPQACDFEVLGALADTVMSHATPEQRRKLAIGLFNTHFGSLPADGSVGAAIVEDFLFLMHAVRRLDIPGRVPCAREAPYRAAALAAMRGAPRGFPGALLAASPLARFLDQNTVRF